MPPPLGLWHRPVPPAVLPQIQRLTAAHPNDPDVIAKNRVKGRLQPTRGLGDGLYKRKEFFLQVPRCAHARATPPGA
jgi:hypothetical protein